MYKIPILFVFFNREDIALKTFAHIKDIKPHCLYLASDGPRKSMPQEKEVVESIRKKILNLIDWPCTVNTRFLDSNIGCSLGVSSAISWMFEKEEYGIVLEDDCVPLKSFFLFVEDMLERYKDDSRIGLVAGFNPIARKIRMPFSYCFSRYKSTWGWATWKRVWNNMDIDMGWRNTNLNDSIIANMGYFGKDNRYWKFRIKAIDRQYVSAWDWQFFFSLAGQNQLTIYPEKNLISNIGFGKDATHTVLGSRSKKYNANNDLSFPLNHPKYIVPFLKFEKLFYNNTSVNF